MSQSLQIGKIRGITLRLHWSWLVAAALLALADGPLLAYLVALLPIVLLHELGHGIVAQHFGLRVLDITFWPLGGFARMSRIPEDARIEGLVAVAGPAVNLGLALLALPLTLVPGTTGALAVGFCLINVLLGATNLLPAFPLDGGRALRAWLGRRGDWVRATERAVATGRFLALALVVVGLVTWNLLLAVFGALFWLSGAQELLAVRLRHGLPPFGLRGFGASFGPGADAAARETTPAESPAAPRAPQPETDPRGGGYSSRDIERLERFHGPLRQLPDER